MAHNFSNFNEQEKINFIKDFFDTKGYIRIREGREKIRGKNVELSLVSNNLNLLNKIKEYLFKLDIKSNNLSQNSPKFYGLAITNYPSLKKFSEIFGFSQKSKRILLKNALKILFYAKRRQWLDEENKFLKENYLNLSDKIIAIKLTRGLHSVRMQRRKLKLKKESVNKWFIHQ